ncbi:MAG TPA: S-methyl-5-thioribose-1-phosphate isomerase [Gammaproteobacteria bacterium]|jgi:methylthioribose-1-phosphate isomerase|nr:S-methyl-5-thioribose-1-phosphate isomerase [Pseudomonadota bacterium]HAY46731.1 S-methyl-5-thioribose-1-phosphate isomerase [Gammaproteobacteria bacterium]
MKVNGKPYRTIWPSKAKDCVNIIDQTRLPFEFVVVKLTTLEDAARAITDMLVRGAPLIGATTAWGIWLAMIKDSSNLGLDHAQQLLHSTRPTAVNLQWALAKMDEALRPSPQAERIEIAFALAQEITDADVKLCSAIGDFGSRLIGDLYNAKSNSATINILTHCNAGWLATVDWGTALAPIYKAHDARIPVHVWVDETRPRNQGGFLTAWELNQHGVPNTVIVDNAGGHLMQHGEVDICIVGTDRTTANGDVCNKIGTYLKALAAKDNNIPFYVAAPSTSIDWDITDGLKNIPIEQRSDEEVSHISGILDDGAIATVQILPSGCTARNDAFDVTPAHLITGIITERGISEANQQSLSRLFPEFN